MNIFYILYRAQYKTPDRKSSVLYCAPKVSNLEPTEKPEKSHKWLKKSVLDDPVFWDKIVADAEKLDEILYKQNEDPTD